MATPIKVLIVDDSEDWQKMTEFNLNVSSTLPYESLCAANGDEALAHYRANSDLSCVILDTDLSPVDKSKKGWLVYDTLRAAGYQGLSSPIQGQVILRNGRSEESNSSRYKSS